MTQARQEGEWPWGVPVPPSGEDLPYDDGEPMETEKHGSQMDLTLDYARRLLRDRQDAYVVGNMAFYYSATQAKNLDFKAPDIMIFLGVERRERKSWVMWEEDGKSPRVVIELLSESTRGNDLGPKKDVYEWLGISDYFVYDPITTELVGWHHTGRFERLAADERGRLYCAALGVWLGVAEHTYADLHAPWLRFFADDGTLLPTHAEAEAARADAEAARADAEAARADAQARRAEAAERELAELRARLAPGG